MGRGFHLVSWCEELWQSMKQNWGSRSSPLTWLTQSTCTVCVAIWICCSSSLLTHMRQKMANAQRKTLEPSKRGQTIWNSVNTMESAIRDVFRHFFSRPNCPVWSTFDRHLGLKCVPTGQFWPQAMKKVLQINENHNFTSNGPQDKCFTFSWKLNSLLRPPVTPSLPQSFKEFHKDPPQPLIGFAIQKDHNLLS